VCEGSEPESREDLSEAFIDCAGRVCCLGNFVVEHDQRPANSFGNAGDSRDVRTKNLDAQKRCAASGQRIVTETSWLRLLAGSWPM